MKKRTIEEEMGSSDGENAGRGNVIAETINSDRAFVIVLTLATKVLLFLLAGQNFIVHSNKTLPELSDWVMLWNRWDVLHYQKLAEFGYELGEKMKPSMVFYPLLPWLTRGLSQITGEYIASSFVIATIASFTAVLIFYNLVRFDFSREIAMRSAWFMLIFPTAYFLHIPYTEGLFLSLSIGSILCARKGRWLLAGVLGLLACLTRANGLVLIFVLAAEAAHQFYETRKWRPEWLAIALVPVGFIVYLGINSSVSGDPFAFIAIRKEFFFISSAPPWTGLMAVVGQLNRGPSEAEMVGIQELIYVLLGLVCTVVAGFKLRPVYSVWIGMNWLLIMSVTFVASVPRYTFSLFPIFILFAMAAKNRYWLAVISVWSLLYLSFFSTLFSRGFWAF